MRSVFVNGLPANWAGQKPSIGVQLCCTKAAACIVLLSVWARPVALGGNCCVSHARPACATQEVWECRARTCSTQSRLLSRAV